VLECAATLRQLARPGDRVIARKWHISYHGGVVPVAFPFTNTFEELAAFAHRSRARWLYLSWPEAETRPQYAFLLDTSAVMPGLVPRKVTAPHPAVLYEIGPEFGRRPAWFDNDTLRAYHDANAWVMIDVTSPKRLYRLGRLAFMTGRYDQATQALETAARLAPRDLDVLLLLGDVHLVRSEAAGARAAFEQARAVAPDNPLPQIGLGWASFIEGDNATAARLWRPVIVQTRHPRTLMRMIDVFGAIGDPEAASLAERTLASLGAGR
jgi:tetratricopeptide (TPR) repeat protein